MINGMNIDFHSTWWFFCWGCPGLQTP